MRSVALDLGTKETSFCEVSQGRVVARRTVQSLEALDDVLGPSSPPARVAIEACREAWFVHDRLQAWGNDVLVVDTTRARQIGVGQHGRKTDRLDAEQLARAVERGGIPLAHVLSPHRRTIREQLSVRRALVETRAQYITTVRGLVRARGQKLARSTAERFHALTRKANLDAETRALVEPLLGLLEALTVEIARVDVALETLCAKEPVIEQLTTAPGVGLIVASAFVSVIDEAGRFRDAHHVASYLGLVPSEDTSGSRTARRLGAITKQGNGYLRAMLVQAAHTLLRVRGDDPLRRWGESVVRRRGRRIAVVALARRLAGVLWAMWRHGAVYDAARVGAASTQGLHRSAQALDVQVAAMKRATQKAKARQKEASRILEAAPPSAAPAPRRRTMR